MLKYKVFLLLSIVLIPLTCFTVITMVSITYETSGGGDCISGITGTNLCCVVRFFEVLLTIEFILVLFSHY
jgi:hypothetical protein